MNTLKVVEAGVVDVSAYLRQNKGNVSVGIPVFFFAYQKEGTNEIQVGRFTGAYRGTDAEGKVVAQFHADSGNIDPTKPIYPRITTARDDDSAEPHGQELQLTFVVEGKVVKLINYN